MTRFARLTWASNNRLRRTVTQITAVMLLLGALSACARAAAQSPAPTPTAARVVDFKVKDLQGQEVQLSSLRGQVTLVNFWATWCSPCREEMPVLEAFYQAHRQEGFTLVAVNVSDDAGDAADFIAENGYTFTVWSDPVGKTLIDLGLRGLPASILLDAEGRLQHFWIGPLTQEILEESVLPLLADHP